MGYTSWSDDTYKSMKTSYKAMDTDSIFTSNKTKSIPTEMSPLNLGIRESRDSVEHPNSLAIMIGLDETGSMGKIPEIIVREKLSALMETLIKNKVEDAHVLFMGIGDQYSDRHPLQVGQFEAGTEELNRWLTSMYIEGNGGGAQDRESYLLAWLVAGRHTSIDCFEKRGKKGFLFTIGDEANWDKVEADTLKELMGYAQAETLSDAQLLAETKRMYHVFHIHVQQGSYRDDPKVIGYWRKMLGEGLILLDDYDKISEVIATTVAVISGAELNDVTSSFDTKTAMIVKKSVSSVLSNVGDGSVDSSGVMNL